MNAMAPATGVYLFGPYRLDAVRRTLARDGKPVILAPRAFDALLLLVKAGERLVTKEELAATLWPGRIVEESSFSQLIFTLRKALAELDPGERFIVTAPGRGYRFGQPVMFQSSAEETDAPDGAVSPARGRTRFALARRFGVRGIAMTLGAVVVLVALVGGFLAWRSMSHLPVGRRSVVLADFDNATGDPVFDHLMAKVLEVDLAQSPFLNVLSSARVADTLGLMTKPRDARLTPALAAEVCARNDGGATISGVLAALGSRYLVTLAATDCVTGRALTEARAEAARKEDVPEALDHAVGHIRADLGESLGSIARFSVPILPKRTSSFDALKAYSQGAWLFNHGSRQEAIALFQHAVELDPEFATAWAGLAVIEANLHQSDAASAAIVKAYALRGTVNERESLHIGQLYHAIYTRDQEAAIRTLTLWTTIYPKDESAWGNLSNTLNTVGRYGEAVEAGRRGLALDDKVEANFAVLMRALTHDGRMAEARAVGERAVAAGVAGDDVRSQLADLSFARGDRAEAARQLAWARGKPGEAHLLIGAALMAFSDGRIRDALALTDQANALTGGHSDYFAAGRARIMSGLGMKPQALAILQGLPADADSQDFRYELAEIGDETRAVALIDRDLARTPHDTLLVGDYAPSVRAAVLLRHGQEVAAVAALHPAERYWMREYDAPYQMGYTLLAADDPVGAAAEFRKILDNPGQAPTNPFYPLARLGLARALNAAGDIPGARREYAAFIARWKTADPDVPALLQAKAEAARL